MTVEELKAYVDDLIAQGFGSCPVLALGDDGKLHEVGTDDVFISTEAIGDCLIFDGTPL